MIGEQNVDGGTTPSSVLTAIETKGLVPYKDCPYNVEAINEPIPVHAMKDAFDSQGALKYQTCLTADDIRRSLDRGFPVTIGVQVDEAFEDFGPGDAPWSFSGETLGGHALCIVGYEPGFVWIVNSWGTSWGIGGFGKISDAMINSEATQDRYSWQFVNQPDKA